MPELTHNSVQQLLMVLERTARNASHGIPFPNAYHDAVRYVSGRYEVTYQTIGDLCRRRLGLPDINEFHQLLQNWLRGEVEPLRRQIKKHSNAAAHAAIDGFFANGLSDNGGGVPGEAVPSHSEAPKPSAPTPPEGLHLRLSHELARRLRLAQLAGLGATVEDTALRLLEAGFEAEKASIRQALDQAVGTS